MNRLNILFVTFHGFIEYVNDFVRAMEDNEDYFVRAFDFPISSLRDQKLTSNEIWDKMQQNIKKNDITHIFFICLPSNDMLIRTKKVNKDITTVFYNFEGPQSFTPDLVKKLNNIDIFINSDVNALRKFKTVTQKELYYHPPLAFQSDDDIDLYDPWIVNARDASLCSPANNAMKKVMIIVNDVCDELEQVLLTRYVTKINKQCTQKHGADVSLFGPSSLENVFCQLYNDVWPSKKEIAESSLVIVIDTCFSSTKRSGVVVENIDNDNILANYNPMNNIEGNHVLVTDLTSISRDIDEKLSKTGQKQIKGGENSWASKLISMIQKQ